METSESSESASRVALVTQLSREIVGLYVRLYGRGPTRARSHIQPSYAVCVLEEIFTTAERTLIEHGSSEQVRESRRRFSEALSAEFMATAEQVVGRKVRVFLSQVDVEANLAVEFFLFEEGE